MSTVLDFIGRPIGHVYAPTTFAELVHGLESGGEVVIGSGTTITADANIELVSNTRLIIEHGATLALGDKRLTAYMVDNVYIGGSGTISWTESNTTDAVPTGWFVRGAIEFGGTTANPSRGFTLEGLRLAGGFAGTPGSVSTDPALDKRRGVLLTNCQNVVVRSNRISGSTAEAVLLNTTTGSPPDFDINVFDNQIWDCNHDAVSQAGLYVQTFNVHGNTMWNCLSGIETNAGYIHDNYAFDMIGSGYGCGGNGNAVSGSPLVIRNNVSRNNGSSGFALEAATLAAGTLICENNHSYNDGEFGFYVTYWDSAIFHGNTATGWGRVAIGSAFGGSNCNFFHVDNNHAFDEGASSNGGFNFVALTRTEFGAGNTTRGVAVPYVADFVDDFADDAAASAGGVPIGGNYRTGSIRKVRVS